MFQITYQKPSYQLGSVSYSPLKRSILEDFLGTDYLFGLAPTYQIKGDLKETDSQYVLSYDLPGYSQTEVTVEVKDTILSITAENKTKGKVNRDLSLWDDIDEGKISADMKNGVLTVVLPKVEQSKPRRIEIK
jgi:HSP20 family protein